jgi:hypothetical protein
MKIEETHRCANAVPTVESKQKSKNESGTDTFLITKPDSLTLS